MFKNKSNMTTVTLDCQVLSPLPQGCGGGVSHQFPGWAVSRQSSGCRWVALALVPGKGGLGHPAALELAWGGGGGEPMGKSTLKNASPTSTALLLCRCQPSRVELKGLEQGLLDLVAHLGRKSFRGHWKKTKQNTTESVRYEGWDPPPSLHDPLRRGLV